MRHVEAAPRGLRQLRLREPEARPPGRARRQRLVRTRSEPTEETPVRAAVDVMGGDKAPAAILKGCWDAVPLLEAGDEILLVGNEQVITDGLANSPLTPDQKKHFRLVVTTQVVEMDDSPVEAIRNKP